MWQDGKDDIEVCEDAVQLSAHTIVDIARHEGQNTSFRSGVKLPSTADRDMMVARIRSAGIKIGTANVWATQDPPILIKARKVFLMEFRWQLIQWGVVKQEINSDDAYAKMHKSPLLVVFMANKDDCLVFMGGHMDPMGGISRKF